MQCTLSIQFLADTFNALFAIMEEMAEEVGDLVFEALVTWYPSHAQSNELINVTFRSLGFHHWTTCCRKIWKFSACLRYILWKAVSRCKCAHVSVKCDLWCVNSCISITFHVVAVTLLQEWSMCLSRWCLLMELERWEVISFRRHWRLQSFSSSLSSNQELYMTSKLCFIHWDLHDL